MDLLYLLPLILLEATLVHSEYWIGSSVEYREHVGFVPVEWEILLISWELTLAVGPANPKFNGNQSSLPWVKKTEHDAERYTI